MRSSARSSPPTCRSSCAKAIPGAFSRTPWCSTCSPASPSTSIRSRTRRREGWWVTGYPWSEINTPEHKAFRDAYQKRWKDYPRLGSVVGYTAVYSVANAVRKAKSADTEKLVEALKGLQMQTPFGPIEWRAIDHQSTMGAYVGQLAKRTARAPW